VSKLSRIFFGMVYLPFERCFIVTLHHVLPFLNGAKRLFFLGGWVFLGWGGGPAMESTGPADALVVSSQDPEFPTPSSFGTPPCPKGWVSHRDLPLRPSPVSMAKASRMSLAQFSTRTLDAFPGHRLHDLRVLTYRSGGAITVPGRSS